MLNDPSSANRGADLSNLILDNIDRIEVVKGPMSVMYGSNATAGVINIITKKGKGPFSCFADMHGGSYKTWKGSAGASGALNALTYSLAASGTTVGGYSIADARNDRIGQAGNTDEKDGYKSHTVSGNVGYSFSSDANLTLITRNTDSKTDLDDYGPGYAGDAFTYNPSTWSYVPDLTSPHKKSVDSKQDFSKISLKNNFYDRFFQSTVSYQLSNQKRDYTNNDGSDGGFYKGDSQECAFQGDLNFDAHILSFGTSYYKETMESTSIDKKDADIISVRIQDQFMPDKPFSVVAGLRLDDHDRYGSKTTYRIAPSYTFDQGTCLKASYATGFRAPSLFELYSPTYGNNDLGAEKSRGWDMGVEQTFKNTSLSLMNLSIGCTYFNMIFDDRIDYDFATSTYSQLSGETKTSGVESYVGLSPMTNLDMTLSYTYTGSNDPQGNQLPLRPYNKYRLNTRYRFFEKALLNLDIQYVDRRSTSYASDVSGNSVAYLDAYTLVNASLSYQIAKNMEIYGRIDNLFNTYYEEVWSYATPGVSGYAGLKVSL
jgi:vitamin B12 transporter